MKFCRWNHYAFPGWHVQVGRAGKKSQTPSPAFQGIRFQLACSFLLCFFLLHGAKVERWECQKVAGDIFLCCGVQKNHHSAWVPPAIISSPLVPLSQGRILYSSPSWQFQNRGLRIPWTPQFWPIADFSCTWAPWVETKYLRPL